MAFTPVMYYKAGRSTFAMTAAEAVDLEYNGWVKNPTATPPPTDPPPTGGTGGTGLVLGTTATTAKRGDYVPSWLEVTGKPTTFAPDAHVHAVNSLSDASVVGKSVLTAASAAAIRALLGVDTGTGSSGLTLGTTSTTAKAGDYVPTWQEVTGKPVSFVPTTHSHGAADLSGVVKTINGAVPDGTGNVVVTAAAPSYANLPVGVPIFVYTTTRPTARIDTPIAFAVTTDPAGAALENDFWFRPQT